MPHRVLIVDDDADLQFLWRSVLENEGFDVMQATDGTQALDVVREQPPDVLVLDGHLPGISGWEVMDALAADPQTGSIPVVLLTGDTSGEAEARSEGATYLTKPVSMSALVGAVRAALRAP